MATAEDIVGYEFLGTFYADVKGRRVLWNGEPLPKPLTLKEYEVLEFFLRSPGQVIERESIEPLDKPPSGRHPADNYLSRIALKLGVEKDDLFRGTRGVGYSLTVSVRPVFASDHQEGGDIFKASELNFNTHTVDSMRASLAQSLRALELNPHGLPEAHVTAAYDYINLSISAFAAELPHSAMPKARQHAMDALKADPRSSRALGVLGLISLIYDYDWNSATTQLEDALDLNPNDAATLLSYAHFLLCSGRPDEAVREVAKAARIDPTDLIIHSSVGWLHLLAGDIQTAITLGEKSTFLYPSFAPAHVMLGWIYEGAGRYSDALRQYETSFQIECTPVALASLGHLGAKLGDRPRGLAALEELDTLHRTGRISYVPGYSRALIFAGLNEVEECLSALEVAYEQQCDWLIHLEVERRWDAVRNYDRFKLLVKKVGLSAPPDAARTLNR